MKGVGRMNGIQEAYIAGLLVGFLTYITLRTVWKCFTEDENEQEKAL